jgi:hypothetical protein
MTLRNYGGWKPFSRKTTRRKSPSHSLSLMTKTNLNNNLTSFGSDNLVVNRRRKEEKNEKKKRKELNY